MCDWGGGPNEIQNYVTRNPERQPEGTDPASQEPEEPEIDVASLLEAMREAWPWHHEGSGGTGDTTSTSWRVLDPALPSEAFARAVLAALSKARKAAPSAPEARSLVTEGTREPT